jgi:hypothetical protein
MASGKGRRAFDRVRRGVNRSIQKWDPKSGGTKRPSTLAINRTERAGHKIKDVLSDLEHLPMPPTGQLATSWWCRGGKK